MYHILSIHRGLIYPWLCSLLPMALATPLSALIFAGHHARSDVFIPLFSLGLLWASLYVLSGNLFVTVMVHFLWNSRVFLGSFLGQWKTEKWKKMKTKMKNGNEKLKMQKWRCKVEVKSVVLLYYCTVLKIPTRTDDVQYSTVQYTDTYRWCTVQYTDTYR